MIFSYIYQDLKLISQLEKSFLLRLIISGFGVMFLTWLSMTIECENCPAIAPALYYWVGVSLTTPILYYAILSFFRSFSDLKSVQFSIDIPIFAALLAAYAYSLYITFIAIENSHAFYDSILLVLFILYAARFLQFFCQRRIAKFSQHLGTSVTKQVHILNGNDAFRFCDVKDIVSGDKISIAPSEYFPVDGIICEGQTSVDESMLSGEAHAVTKNTHDTVRAGTCNLEKQVVMIATSTFRNSHLGKLLSTTESTIQKQPQPLTDQIALWHQMLILTIVAAIYCWWLPFDSDFALYCAICSLLITCPCAIAIAYPLTCACVIEACAKKGILINNPVAFFKLAMMEHILFDKTGTLTQGNIEVDDLKLMNQASIAKVLPIIASIEKMTEHSIAKAIAQYIDRHFPDLEAVPVQKLRVFPGLGIRAHIDGKVVLLGQARWLAKQGIIIAPDVITQQERLHNAEFIFVHCAIDGVEVARIQLKDHLRNDANETIEFFKEHYITSSVLSGDRPAIVNAIAKQLGAIGAFAQALPQGKEAHIAQLQDQRMMTAMVGDGLNDAPALKRADIGIAMGHGNPFTLLCADIILTKPELRPIQECYLMSIRARKILNQCYCFALLFNLCMLPLTALGKLNPMSMLIGIAFSALVMMGNIARLRF